MSCSNYRCSILVPSCGIEYHHGDYSQILGEGASFHGDSAEFVAKTQIHCIEPKCRVVDKISNDGECPDNRCSRSILYSQSTYKYGNQPFKNSLVLTAQVPSERGIAKGYKNFDTRTVSPMPKKINWRCGW
jgi:hypothetical protein